MTEAVSLKSTLTLPEVPDGTPEPEAVQFREQVLSSVARNLVWGFLVAGKMLSEIAESGHLQRLGVSMREYLAGLGVGFGEATASKLVKVYRVFVKERGLPAEVVAEIGDYEKAYRAALLVQRGMAVEEAVETAKALSRSDLRTVEREQRGEEEVNAKLIERRLAQWRGELNDRQRAELLRLLVAVREQRDDTKAVLRAALGCAEQLTGAELFELAVKLTEEISSRGA